jgi:RNA polymerase sigma-70 factor (ECF subfamily)
MDRALAGSSAAFADLFSRHARSVGRLAYLLLHDWNGAEDVLQESYLRGWMRRSTWRAQSEPRAWLLAIALNLVRNILRDGRCAVADPATLDQVHAPRRGVVTSVLRHETRRELAVALGFLTEPQREVFVLHYIEGVPYEELAPMRRVSVDAVRHLAHRARAVLQERIPRHVTAARGS